MADKRISLPAGKAVYPRLKTPDTKFDEHGIYKADVSVPVTQAKGVMTDLQAIYKAHTGKPAKASENTMWVMETDDAGEETGNVIFKCRVKNRLNKKGELWDRRPKQFDAALNPIDVNPWGGSVMAVSVDVYEWVSGNKKGVSLQPVGVQILELISGSGPDASSMGFKAQEGFTADTSSDTDDEDDIDDDDADEVDDDEDVGGADY
jgi:hypothetical protein